MTAAPSRKAPPASNMPEAPALIVGLHYAMPGDMRYLSHHDELRMLIRSLTRASWPLLYTRGFNPIPRLSVPLPRSTGIAAEEQLAIIELRSQQDLGEIEKAAAKALPAQAPVLGLTAPLSRRAAPAAAATFLVELLPHDLAGMAERIERLLSRPSVEVQRDVAPGKPARRVDIRPYVLELALTGAALNMKLGIQNQATARPAEVLAGLELSTEHRSVTRTRVEWEISYGAARDQRAPQSLL